MKKLLSSILLGLVVVLLSSSITLAQEAPGPVTGVEVEYPECDESETCSFVQASCKWDPVVGADTYTYTITEVESNTQVQSATVGNDVLRVVFPITQERTYRCDVFATNEAGQSGGTGTHELFCSAEGLIDDPTPTPVPPTATPAPTKPPIEAPGGFMTTAVVLGGVLFVIIGGLALILL